MARLAVGMRAHLRLLAFYLANGTLDLEVLSERLDYSAIFTEPSVLEQAFAVWANVLEIDDQGTPVNAGAAQRRMAQYIRGFIDPSYTVDPPFKDSELDLAL